MDINKKDQKNRTELKGYFIKNSIPTQKQFEELIDGMLNQKDDGIAKPSVSDPLSIQAVGDTAKVINFYEDFKNDKPAWTLLLKPHIDPAKPETVKSGFCISDGQGNNRLFIDSGTGNVSINGGVGITGNVGIGTPSNPLYSLDISSPSAIRFDFGVTEEDINGDVSDGGQLIVTGGFNGVKLLAGIGNNSLTLGIQESIPTLVLGANGADLYGNVRIDGDLILDNRKTYNSTI